MVRGMVDCREITADNKDIYIYICTYICIYGRVYKVSQSRSFVDTITDNLGKCQNKGKRGA